MNLRIRKHDFWGNLAVVALFIFALGFLYAFFDSMQDDFEDTFYQLVELDETARTP